MKKTAILLLTALISLSGYSQKIKGSDTVLPLSQKEAEAYAAKGGKVSVTAEAAGSEYPHSCRAVATSPKARER